MDRRNTGKINLKPYLMLTPLISLYLIFILGGLIEVLKESLGYIPFLNKYEYTPDYYLEILNNDEFIKNLLYSIYIASTGAIISTILGVFTAYFFITSNNYFLNFITKKVLEIGLIIPYLYVVFLTVVMLSDSGFISRVFYNIGLIKELSNFNGLIYTKYGFGIIFVYIFKGVPFVSLFMINIMKRISIRYSDTAKTLGMKDINILFNIYLPLSKKTLIWVLTILFAYDLGSFEVLYILSRIDYIPLAVKLYSSFINPNLDFIPNTMALSIIILVISILFSLLASFSINLLLGSRKK